MWPAVIIAAAAWRTVPLLPQQAAVSVQKTLSKALGLLTDSRAEQPPEGQVDDRGAEESFKAMQHLVPLLSCPMLPTESAAALDARQQSLLAWASATEATARVTARWQRDLSVGWSEQWASLLQRLLVLPAELLDLPHGGVAADDATILNNASASWGNLAGSFARFVHDCIPCV